MPGLQAGIQAWQSHNVSCNWTANGYRLPTEMEWQFAARGGNQSHGYTYSGSNTVGDVAWYYSNSGSTTHTVGTKAANELGIFDMTGNVWEWVWDIYGDYPGDAQTDPHGATSGSNRVYRGGSWGNSAVTAFRIGTTAMRPTRTTTLASAASGFSNDLGCRNLFGRAAGPLEETCGLCKQFCHPHSWRQYWAAEICSAEQRSCQ